MRCKKCNYQINNAKFCTKCGTPAKAAQSRAAAKSSAPVIIAIVTVILLSIIAFIVILSLLNNARSGIDLILPQTGNGVAPSAGSASDNVQVPMHMGMPIESARALLAAAGLNLHNPDGYTEHHDTIAPGHITQSEFPLGTEMVAPGTTVNVVVSIGPPQQQAAVPDLAGMHLDDAVALAAAFDFAIIPIDFTHHDSIPLNHIISQEPINAGVVNITVSLGTDVVMIVMPDLAGMTDLAARSAIVQAGLIIGNVVPMESAEPAGAVVWQNLVAGTQVLAGTMVDFHVSTGTGDTNAPLMPDFTGPGAAQGDLPYTTLNAQGQRIYVFQAGDTLWSIATRIYNNGHRWADIMAANGMTEQEISNISVGTVLIIPN